MAIFRVSKDKNYTIIDNQYLKDEDLSFGSIGLMTIILSCKDDTKFSLKLISITTEKSIKLVTKYLNELKKSYYINVIKHNSKDGYYYDYFVYESKQLNPNYTPDY